MRERKKCRKTGAREINSAHEALLARVKLRAELLESLVSERRTFNGG